MKNENEESKATKTSKKKIDFVRHRKDQRERKVL